MPFNSSGLSHCPDTVAGQNKHKTLAGRVTLADVTKLPHFLSHAPQFSVPEEQVSLLSFPSADEGNASASCPGNGEQSTSQLGCRC